MGKLWTFGDSFTAGHGCKYTPNTAFSINANNEYYNTFKDYIVDRPIWNQILSNALSMELVDESANGYSTELIIDAILKNISSMSSDDIVIFQTSTIGRFDFPFLKEKTLMGYDTTRYKRDTNLFELTDSPYFFKTIFTSNIKDEYSIEKENMLQYTNGQENTKDKSLVLNKLKYDTIRNFFSEFLSTGKYYERSIWRIIEFSKLLKLMGVTSYIINEDIWPMYIPKPDNLMEMHVGGMFGYVASNNKSIYYDTNGTISDWHPSYDGHIDIANFILNFINNADTDLHNA
jgi:hypothetical protein